MSETLETRNFILKFLHRELVGPSPLPEAQPGVQEDGEEILRPQDPPRHRYGAGVLFPSRYQVPSNDETAENEEVDSEADSPESAEIPEGLAGTDSQQGESGGASNTDSPETDQEVNLANQYLPSAMGLSALVEVPERLLVEVSTATYRQGDAPQSEGGRSVGKPWLRQPLSETIEFRAAELLGSGNVSFDKKVVVVDGKPTLIVHVISRPDPSGRSERTRLITLTLVNRRESESRAPRNEDCFFQCGFTVSSADGERCFLSYPERPSSTDDPEELSLQLLHLHRQTFAVGHGCAAGWGDPLDGGTSVVRTETLPTYEVKPILHAEVEGLDLSMAMLAHGDLEKALDLCNRLADAYEAWIEEQEREVASRSDLTPELRATADRHLEDCRECLKRMRDGIGLISEDSESASAFRLMNEAMLMQQVHYEIASQRTRPWVNKSGRLELKTDFEPPSYDDPSRKWRPFQLAFILMNLKSLADPHCDEREMVDVIWFPTGGGKTEAYLGLSAFAMFLRRIRNADHAGTSILMRYTLRLLTTQQFQRAASLICACEVIRRRGDAGLGSKRFSIGLWVGGEVTPNEEKGAVTALRQFQRGQGANKFILLSCPWCGAGMGQQKLGRRTEVKGYRIQSLPQKGRPQRVRHRCEDGDCEFSSDAGLPVAVIDEHIYQEPPTLLIGTVDKFAMLAFRSEARSIFGIGTPFPPPELIIQDELHLISGPLGSMVGHYETVIDALCTDEASGGRVHPKIIGSTATISRAEEQVKALYGRSAFSFPPQALRAGDSFFAKEREDQEGRTYVGVFASAMPSHVTSQVRTMAALLQAPKLSGACNPSAIDPYWTLMGYFNTLRELGHAATLIRGGIREYLNAMWDRLGLGPGATPKAGLDPRRFIDRDEELTSRVQSGDIPAILQRLFEKYTYPAKHDAIDVCLATNMIQVGLDIPRLSLMTIVGQPKTTSEYIQASSRIGRRESSPGIVVTNYNPSRSRDRSHYERFRSYHQTLYQHVEPTSVTPFAVPVRERALHALIVILCRFWGGASLRDSPTEPPDNALIQRVERTIQERVMSIDPDEWAETKKHIDEIMDKWSNAPRSKYGDFRPPTEELPMMYPAGDQPHPEWYERPYPTQSSMRNVDASCSARVLQRGYGD